MCVFEFVVMCLLLLFVYGCACDCLIVPACVMVFGGFCCVFVAVRLGLVVSMFVCLCVPASLCVCDKRVFVWLCLYVAVFDACFLFGCGCSNVC